MKMTIQATVSKTVEISDPMGTAAAMEEINRLTHEFEDEVVGAAIDEGSISWFIR